MVTEQNRKYWILAAMTGALIVILLDQTIVSVALPAIQRSLHLTQEGVQWVVTAYMLAIASTIALCGQIGDRLGWRHAFIIGIFIFIISSVAVASAQNETQIILFRILQGIGAAMMRPTISAMLISAADVHERGKFMAISIGVGTLFMVLGPVLGGLITEYASWRYIFWLNVPVTAIVLTITWFARPPNEKNPRSSFDIIGTLLLIPGAATLILGLQQGNEWGWRSPITLSLVVGGIVLLFLFVLQEMRTKQPLVELRLFKEKAFSADSLVLFCAQFSMVAQIIFGSLYLQYVLKFTSVQAGGTLMLVVAPLILSNFISGRIYDKHGPRIPGIVGMLMLTVGLATQVLGMLQQHFYIVATGMLAVGVGIGFVLSPLNTDALGRAPKQLRGQVSGLIQTLRQMAGSISMAAIGAIIIAFHSNGTQTISATGAAYGFGFAATIVFIGALIAITQLPSGHIVLDKEAVLEEM